MSKLLNFIIESIEYDRLIEEGKDPVEVLHYKFQNIPSDIIDSVIEIDPTKKKSFSQWLLSHWGDEKNTIVKNLKNGRIAKLFQHYKEHDDVQIKNCPSVEEGLRRFVPEEDTVLTKSTKPRTILTNRGWTEEVPSELANDFDVVFNKDNWVIAVPNTYEAECKLGENMNWCTAGGRGSFRSGRDFFNRYLNEYGGKYYVNFDMSEGESRLGKDYPFTRYQFHFETNQFMDKEDEPVDLYEINMPESAKEFYSDEGYDTDNITNLEARMERYDEQRWGCSYRINEDLHLCIDYDEDYEFTEPNADTDFFLFSDEDYRDPISFDAIANPHLNEGVVILNDDINGICILRQKYGKGEDSVVVAMKVINGGWYRWEAFEFDKYLLLQDEASIFGFNGKGRYCLATDNGEVTFDELETSQCEDIFINEYCTKADADEYGMIFVEAVGGEYHSLFAIAPNECQLIVGKDVPKNGKYYTIDENGLVEGEFRSYRVYDDDYYDSEDTSSQYDLESKLGNGDFLVSITKANDYGRYQKQFNIIKRGSTEPLFEDLFDKYVGATSYLYSFKKGHGIGFFKISDGRQVGRWYDDYGSIDKVNDIIYGITGTDNAPKMIDVISGSEGRVTATFKNIVSTKAANNKIIVQETDGFTSRVYDYMENKFYFPELNAFLRVLSEYPFIFACKVSNTEEMALFDLSSLKILCRGIKKITKIHRGQDEFIKLEKMDGKYNAFDMENSVEMLPTNVDAITSMNSYLGILTYELNGKSYPYDYRHKRVVINPNGIALPTYVGDGDKIFCEGENYNIYFVQDGNGNFKFYSWDNRSNYNDYGTNFDPKHTPQEVMNMYNLIYGQQESITSNFRDYVKRIDEAMKYRCNDIID